MNDEIKPSDDEAQERSKEIYKKCKEQGILVTGNRLSNFDTYECPECIKNGTLPGWVIKARNK